MAKASQKTDATKPSEETAVAAATAKVEAVVPPAEAAGLRRSAIALLLLGDEISEGLFRAFRPIHVRRILDASKTLRGVTEEEVLSVLEGLVGELENGVIGVSGHAHRIEEAAVSVFGADLIRASRDVKGAAMQMHAVAVEKPEAFARTLAGEHPQAIAIVLAMLAPEVGANVLQMMPAQLKVDVVRRIARLKSVNASVLAGVTESVGREFGQVGDEGPVTLNGTDMAVKLLKSVGSLDEQLILNALDELDTDLTETIRSKLFTFEDVLQLHDREIQMVMREVDQRSLPMALKTASTELADKLLSNVSSRAAAMLRDDMQALGPVTIAQVEEAQQGIVSQIMALAAEGRVNLRPGDTV